MIFSLIYRYDFKIRKYDASLSSIIPLLFLYFWLQRDIYMLDKDSFKYFLLFLLSNTNKEYSPLQSDFFFHVLLINNKK